MAEDTALLVLGVSAAKWGLPAATPLLMAGMPKFSRMPVMQANRVICEVKRFALLLTRKPD